MIAIGSYLFLSVVLGILLIESAMHPQRLITQQQFETGASHSHSQGVALTASDGAILRASLIRPQQPNGNSVLLLHGSGDNWHGMLGYAPMLFDAGYNVLLPDSRVHGESGGNLATYGLLEADDIHRWSEWLQAQFGSKGCVDILGESMGAAIAIQSARLPLNCAVVAEAPFSSFREIGYERISQSLGIGVGFTRIAAWPTVESAFLYTRLRYGLDFDKVSPEQALASSHVPTLLIAGLADDNIPPRHSERILSQAGPGTELWQVPRAGHTAAASIAPEEFRSRVLNWFAAHSRQNP